MKYLKQEGGYAMLIVIGVMLLFTTIGMGLLAMNINASKQFSIKEEQVQARHQAEMGLLHYNVALTEKVKSYSFSKRSGEANAAALSRSRTELCIQIKSVVVKSEHDSAVRYSVDVPSVSGCDSTDINEKIIVTALSKGSAYDNTEKVVKGTISFNPPEVTDSSGVPGPPVIPPGASIITNKNDLKEDTVKEHVVINGLYEQQHERHYFESFTINVPSESDKALIIGSGKGNSGGDVIKVEKDFYIGGKVDMGTQSCIYVKGNLVVLGDIDTIKNKSAIIVYGDAYFKGDIKGQGTWDIMVAGNTYLGEDKTLRNDYKSNKLSTGDCKKLSDWGSPGVGLPGAKEFHWEPDGSLNPEYI